MALQLKTILQPAPTTFLLPPPVTAPNVDNQQASSTITATNTINNGAFANYHAGQEVLLKNGFTAATGSEFRGYILGCTAITASTAKKTTIAPVAKETNIKLYPNPVDDKLYINNFDKITDWKLYSLNGTLCKQSNIIVRTKDVIEIDMTNLPKGIYVVKITLKAGEKITEKIIKR